MCEKIRFSGRSFIKAVLHSAKYPDQALNGFLIGKLNELNEVDVVDSVPLFHCDLNLAPALEAAFCQVEQYFIKKGLLIVGLYFVGSNITGNNIPNVLVKSAERIYELNKHCSLMFLNNSAILPVTKASFKILSLENEKWTENNEWTLSAKAGVKAAKLIESDVFNYLFDFDNHLDEPEIDWRNNELNQLLSSLN